MCVVWLIALRGGDNQTFVVPGGQCTYDTSCYTLSEADTVRGDGQVRPGGWHAQRWVRPPNECSLQPWVRDCVLDPPRME